jgi:hypothetical protein
VDPDPPAPIRGARRPHHEFSASIPIQVDGSSESNAPRRATRDRELPDGRRLCPNNGSDTTTQPPEPGARRKRLRDPDIAPDDGQDLRGGRTVPSHAELNFSPVNTRRQSPAQLRARGRHIGRGQWMGRAGSLYHHALSIALDPSRGASNATHSALTDGDTPFDRRATATSASTSCGVVDAGAGVGHAEILAHRVRHRAHRRIIEKLLIGRQVCARDVAGGQPRIEHAQHRLGDASTPARLQREPEGGLPLNDHSSRGRRKGRLHPSECLRFGMKRNTGFGPHVARSRGRLPEIQPASRLQTRLPCGHSGAQTLVPSCSVAQLWPLRQLVEEVHVRKQKLPEMPWIVRQTPLGMQSLLSMHAPLQYPSGKKFGSVRQRLPVPGQFVSIVHARPKSRCAA